MLQKTFRFKTNFVWGKINILFYMHLMRPKPQFSSIHFNEHLQYEKNYHLHEKVSKLKSHIFRWSLLTSDSSPTNSIHTKVLLFNLSFRSIKWPFSCIIMLSSNYTFWELYPIKHTNFVRLPFFMFSHAHTLPKAINIMNLL